MRKALLVVLGLCLVSCGKELPTTPAAPAVPILVLVSPAKLAVDQVAFIRANGGNGDYRTRLVVYGYQGNPWLDVTDCLGYFTPAYNGGQFLFRPQESCSSRPQSVQVEVSDSAGNVSGANLDLVY